MSRPQRNRRLSRRVWSPEHDLHQNRPVKRLFTPEIKRMLKDWLVRRRENPYPSRDEKKRLAIETGLTYTQICNWFANWRRKLKNSEREKAKNSWGTLIKNYNTNARGNVEQFSISSEDSIWEEDLDDELSTEDDYRDDSHESFKKCSTYKRKDGYEQYHNPMSYQTHVPNHYDQTVKMEHCNYNSDDNVADVTAQCFQITSTTTERHDLSKNPPVTIPKISTTSNYKTKYKQKMMEKYLRDTYAQEQKVESETLDVETPSEVSGATELSKWLESAAKFTPNKNNYFVEWNERNKSSKQRNIRTLSSHHQLPHESSIMQNYNSIHHKDELDAAEALANLAFNCRQRMLESCAIQTPINAISS